MLRKEAQDELKRLSHSKKLRHDCDRLQKNKRNHFLKNGKIDIDAFIEFLDEYNALINHARPPFRPMQDHNMKI